MLFYICENALPKFIFHLHTRKEKMDIKEVVVDSEKAMETQEPVEEAQDESKNKKRKIFLTGTDARAHNIHGHFTVPQETLSKIEQVTEILGNAAVQLDSLFKLTDVKYDLGRFIASLDAIQLAKDIAVNSLTLPHVHILG